VFNMGGELVAVVAEDSYKAGDVGFAWDGKNTSGSVVPNGVYFFSVQAGSNMMSRRVIVLNR